MKSLPEKKIWNTIRSRLLNYSEEPDDRWDMIMAEVPKRNNYFADYAGHTFTGLALLTFLFLLEYGQPLNNRNDLSVASSPDQNGLQSQPSSLTKDLTTVPRDSMHSEVDLEDEMITGKTADERMPIVDYDQDTFIPLKKIRQQIKIDNSAIRSYLRDNVDSSIGLTDKRKEQIIINSFQVSGFKISAATGDSILAEPTRLDTIRVVTATKGEDVKRERKRNFSPVLFATITPFLGYQKLTPDRSDDLMITSIGRESMVSHRRLGIHADAGFHYRISRFFEGFIGISYYGQKQSFSYEFLTSDIQDIESTKDFGYRVTPASNTKFFEMAIKNVGVTAGGFYLLKDSRLSHRLGAGIQYNKSISRVANENGVNQSSSALINVLVMYRMQIRIHDRLEWYLQPTFSQSLSTHKIPGEPIELKPYRAGIGTGILYHF